jgi:hypothetical protein
MKCRMCEKPLIDYLEEVLTVTIQRITRIHSIEWESDDGEVLFDYDPDSCIEEDLDCDTPATYQCGYCGEEYHKRTVVEILKKGKED